MKKIKYLILVFLCIICTKVYSQQRINDIGIYFNSVNISTKNFDIINPLEIIYEKPKDKLIFTNNIEKYMKTAGYWISKLNTPDNIILNAKEIKLLNDRIVALKVGIADLKKYPDVINKERFLKTLNQRLLWMTAKTFVDENGQDIDSRFFTDLHNNIDINENMLRVKFAITTKYNDVRVLPTDTKVLSSIDSWDIDRLQEESLDLGTPVAVLCMTKDKIWSYIAAPTEEGWIKTENLAFTDKKTLNKWINTRKFAVIINEKADIFADKKKQKFIEYVRMGTKLPLVSKTKNALCIKIPAADKNRNLVIKKAYINHYDSNAGFLKYTQRNVLMLAFKHLNSPYGWGGADGEQDCSGYLGQIFNCFGILLPETSIQKIKCGKVVYINPATDIYLKNKIITDNAVAGLTFVYLPGHIMLYIGDENGVPYVIHSIWGLSVYNDKNEKTINYINKVIVSDLSIGAEVSRNSLIERTSKINIIK